MTSIILGYKWSDISSCVQWMAPFAMTLRDDGPVKVKFLSQVSENDVHNIQTHSVDLSLLVSRRMHSTLECKDLKDV